MDRGQEGPTARHPLDHPGAPGALLLGKQALQDDRYEVARGWFEAALRLDPSLGVGHLCLGLTLQRLGEDEQAIGSLARVLDRDPTDPEARLHLVRSLVALERNREALEHLSLLAGADPDLDTFLFEHPDLAPLRDHPRFLAMLDRLDP